MGKFLHMNCLVFEFLCFKICFSLAIAEKKKEVIGVTDANELNSREFRK